MAASKVKFTRPDAFKGDHKLLRTWLFRMNEYTELCGITIPTEKVKLAVLGLEGAALTWWESVQTEPWAVLGALDWLEFSTRICEAFRDDNHNTWKLTAF